MDKSKLLEYFDASEIKAPIHIIGCGAIGSHIAEQLARMGCENIHLWDFDTVDAHNITNQMFIQGDIGNPKVYATAATMVEINPDLKVATVQGSVIVHDKGWQGETLTGYVFLCVDNIDLRREIVKVNQYNPNCIAFFDFRMRLTDAQHYMAVRADADSVKKLLASMNFTHDEAKDATPKSACNVELSVVYTVKCITALGISNFVKLILGKPTKEVILIDLNLLTLDAFPME
jgi:molybdopterin/thiamine biosynthesis adenylyltransferase